MLTRCEWPGWRSIERGVKIGLWAVAHQWTHGRTFTSSEIIGDAWSQRTYAHRLLAVSWERWDRWDDEVGAAGGGGAMDAARKS